ncbi:MAG: enoyl-CoA hydratase-related protein [Bryobacteraceae bacterium]
MSYSQIAFDIAGDGIALLTVNRPQKLNALNAETFGELNDAFSRVETDASIRALIVTGAGEKAFVAGTDIQELAGACAEEAQRIALRGQRTFRRLELMNKPSIAAVNGFALGGGLELAMACTLRIASANAKLGQPEVKLGTLPGYGGSQRLPRLVGRGRALEMLLTGDPIDAAEAYRIGLVNQVVPQSELLEAAATLLRKVLKNGPVAVGLTMQAVDSGLSSGLEEGLRFEAAAFGLTAATEDYKEGTKAFLEKRAAVFIGR